MGIFKTTGLITTWVFVTCSTRPFQVTTDDAVTLLPFSLVQHKCCWFPQHTTSKALQSLWILLTSCWASHHMVMIEYLSVKIPPHFIQKGMILVQPYCTVIHRPPQLIKLIISVSCHIIKYAAQPLSFACGSLAMFAWGSKSCRSFCIMYNHHSAITFHHPTHCHIGNSCIHLLFTDSLHVT